MNTTVYELARKFLYSMDTLLLFPYGKERRTRILHRLGHHHIASYLNFKLMTLFQADRVIKPVEMKNYRLFIRRFLDKAITSPNYEKGLLEYVELNEGMTIVEVGSHIGRYTMEFAFRVGAKGRVIALEPDPSNFLILKLNIMANQFGNVLPVNAAAGDYNGCAYLRVTASSGLRSIMRNSLGKIVKVRVRTLDALINELGAPEIDFMKIDAEGADVPILRGAKGVLTSAQRLKLIIEVHHKRYLEIEEELAKYGFKTRRILLSDSRYGGKRFIFAEKSSSIHQFLKILNVTN